MAKKTKVQDPRVTSVISELGKVYSDGLKSLHTSKGDLSRMRYLRPSQLPFCPINFFTINASQGPLRIQDMESAFYTSIGTTVHTVVQKYLSHSGKFLARWTCKQCGKVRKISMNNQCCDFTMEYDEVLIRHKGVVGHIDAIYRDKYGDYWILDFKTTSVASALAKSRNPGISYEEQIETYAYYVREQYGITVKGVLLMFIKRDSPKAPIMFGRVLKDIDFDVVAKRIKKYKKMHHEVLHIETLKEAKQLLKKYGKCNNPMCDTCGSYRSYEDAFINAYHRGKSMKYLPLINVASK